MPWKRRGHTGRLIKLSFAAVAAVFAVFVLFVLMVSGASADTINVTTFGNSDSNYWTNSTFATPAALPGSLGLNQGVNGGQFGITSYDTLGGAGFAEFNIGAEEVAFLWSNNIGGQSIDLYSGANGTGSLLDQLSAPGGGDFLDVINDTTADIGSLSFATTSPGGSSFAFNIIPDVVIDPPPSGGSGGGTGVAVTPLPPSVFMFLTGLLGLVGFTWRRRKAT